MKEGYHPDVLGNWWRKIFKPKELPRGIFHEHFDVTRPEEKGIVFEGNIIHYQGGRYWILSRKVLDYSEHEITKNNNLPNQAMDYRVEKL